MSQKPTKATLFLREKLACSGPEALADAELLAVFISNGNAQKSCLEIAYELLNRFGDVRAILNADALSFQAIPGLGQVKYLQLQAVKELCSRSHFISLQKNFSLKNTEQTFLFLKRQLRDKKNETFVAIFLDSQCRVISYEELFHGTINSAQVHSRPLVERALQLNAAAIIIAHNHPSGLSDASEEDYQVTYRLTQALELIDVQLLDHLVIGDNEVFSITHRLKWPCH